MTVEQYTALAAQLRRKARAEESPAFRTELEDLARCYEWAASAICGTEAAAAVSVTHHAPRRLPFGSPHSVRPALIAPTAGDSL